MFIPLPVDTCPPPIRGDFLVSFVIDSRGGAMKGTRGSGLRILIPPGAVEQPVRVTLRSNIQSEIQGTYHNFGLLSRFVRPGHVSCPPRLIERDSLASGIYTTMAMIGKLRRGLGM